MNHKRMFVTLCAALATANFVHAQSTFASAQLDRPSGIFDGAINESITNPTGSVEHAIGDEWGSASTYALADFGSLKAHAVATGAAEPYGRFYARSGVGFTDPLTFVSRGLEGQSGLLQAMIVFDRKLSFQGAAVDSYATVALNIATSFDTLSYTETLMCNPSVPGCVPQLTTALGGTGTISLHWNSPTALSLSIPIVFGQNTGLFLSLDAQALATYYVGSSTWKSDASHSLYWGGISAVLDQSGQPVSFDVSSASGADYLHTFAPTVPEPATYLIFTVGSLVIAIQRRRRLRRGADA